MIDPQEMQEEHPEVPEVLPILPVRDVALFPMAMAPILVNQERSVKLVDDAMRAKRLVGVVLVRNTEVETPGPNDLYRVGTFAVVRQLFRGPDEELRLLVQGIARIRIEEFTQTEPYLLARVVRLQEVEADKVESDALANTLRHAYAQYVRLSPNLSDELADSAERVTDVRQLLALITSTIGIEPRVRQELLELEPMSARLRRLVDVLQHELAVQQLEREISKQTQQHLSDTQREYILRQHMKTIQKELGEGEGGGDRELVELRKRLDEAGLPEEARKEADRELAQLDRTPAGSMEYGTARAYLEWLASLPWKKTTGAAIDIPKARTILDEDHYDLEKIKDRIVENLAVRKLREERHAVAPQPQPPDSEAGREPILCFVGPPGVGKTSLGQSIARAMGRRFVRVSLGGVHDEAEIRGHRRTYVGAMPGRIIQALRRAEAADPVFMLDEVDKLGIGFHGDPAAALLEVLDPAQNGTFVDTYLSVPFDLRRVLFICTANTVETIPAPLLDRMEVLALSGYTEAEKLSIARRYLWSRLLRAHGLLESEVSIDDDAIRKIIREYTREAGVRGVERELATILRKTARRITEGTKEAVHVDAEHVKDFLGPPRFFNEVVERVDRPGVATGLAWTPVGGDVLFVEAAMMPGKEHLILTGMLGDVMRESAQAALTYLRSNAIRLGIDPAVFEHKSVHVHVPAGAIPKDGPSAGVAILTALTSLVTGRVVAPHVAMTGEITLRGKVLPVGGIKEKVLAGYRAGIRTVILPRRNENALADVPDEIRGKMSFVLADTAEDVLNEALAEHTEDAATETAQQPATAAPALH